MSSPSIKIVGAGLGGLALGQCLRRKNIPAVIYDHVKQYPWRNNYGITLYKSTYRPLLDALRITEDEFTRQVAVHHPDNGAAVSDGQRLRINRSLLATLLEQGLDIRWEKLVNPSAPSAPPRIPFVVAGEQSTEPLDLLIAADGVHSAIRPQLGLPQHAFDLKVLPYVVFSGRRRIEYSNLPIGLLDCFETPDGITHTQNGTVLSIKADYWNAKRQNLAVSYTLSRAAGEEDQPLLHRNIGKAKSLAKLFVKEVSVLGQLPAPFGQLFNTRTMPEDRLLHWLMRSSLIDDKAFETVVSERGTVLLGDAAHAQPIPGNGGNLAIDDAVEAAKHIDVAGRFDALAYLKARSEAWAKGKQENEQALEDLHPSSGHKAKL